MKRVGVQSVADFQTRKIGDNLTIGPFLQSLPVPANSDFFPYVDLNAPRLRYPAARRTQMELPSIFASRSCLSRSLSWNYLGGVVPEAPRRSLRPSHGLCCFAIAWCDGHLTSAVPYQARQSL